jgi:glycosyltransferase involved in cell wall biosynthesis
MGFKVVITNHGPDYDREKWGKTAKAMLRLGEKLGGVYANEVIAISSMIANIIYERCHRKSNIIYNGVTLPQKSKKKGFLEQFGIKPGKYVLAVARFVPEKGLHDLIEAVRMLDHSQQLVIVGDADHETVYSRNLRSVAAEDKRIVLTGYLTGESLNQVYTHAVLFVLPSYHEGLPIVLLEAMSYGIPVLVSDIPANNEVKLSVDRYFKCGDIKDLKAKMQILLEKGLSDQERKGIQNLIEEKYNWNKIADRTIEVYRKVLAE